MFKNIRVTSSLAGLAIAVGSPFVHAEGLPAEPDQPSALVNAQAHLDRAWFYLDESRVASQWQTLALSQMTYTNVGTTGAMAGARISILPSDFETTRAVVSVGYLRELSGASGAWGRFTFSQDIDRLRLGSTIHVERVIAAQRDPIDIMVMAGANMRLANHLRAGAEYVGQDLEEFVEAEMEGGAHHFIGPSASLSWLDDRMTLTAGSAFGLTPSSPRLVGRLGLAFAF